MSPISACGSGSTGASPSSPTARESEAFAAELIDRFGKLPAEVENLLQIIAIKRRCREAGVERVEAGPKGAVVTLRGNRFANPAGLVELIQKHAGTLRLRPDQKLVYLRNWEDEADPPQRRRRADAGAGPARPRRREAEPRRCRPDAGADQGAGGWGSEAHQATVQVAIRSGLMNSMTPSKYRSFMVTTAKLFAAAVRQSACRAGCAAVRLSRCCPRL